MLPIGHILNDRYRIEELLGHGGMAAVYLVTHLKLHRRFALKIVAANLASQPQLLDRFRREINILSAIEHPNVVNIIDCDSYQGQFPYLVMEHLKGQDLARFLTQNGALEPTRALPIFLQIANALGSAHSHNVVHRDLKPGNIFLCERGPFPNFVKVLDFGIAKILQRDSGVQTHGSGVIGTPAYMAPEQALGQNHLIDARTDQFALASILYELLTGQPAFYRPGEPMLLTLARVVKEEPPVISDPRIDEALRRAWRKDPTERFASLQDFVDATGAMELTAPMTLAALPSHSSSQETLALPSQPTIVGSTSVSNQKPLVSSPSAPSLWAGELRSRFSSLVAISMLIFAVALAVFVDARLRTRATSKQRQLVASERITPTTPVVTANIIPAASLATVLTTQESGIAEEPVLMSHAPSLPPSPALPPPPITLPPPPTPTTEFPVITAAPYIATADLPAPIKVARPVTQRPARIIETRRGEAGHSRIFILSAGLTREAAQETERCVRHSWSHDLAKLVNKSLVLSFRRTPMLRSAQPQPIADYNRQLMNRCLLTGKFPAKPQISAKDIDITINIVEEQRP